MQINKYPDGTSYVTVEESHSLDHVFKINSYQDLWYLNQYVDAYNFRNVNVPRILIPNLIDAQADRRFSSNASSGLKLVCNFLNSMNANFKIFHPHNPEVVEALMDNVTIIDNTEFIRKVLLKLDASCEIPNHSKNVENTVLMASDAGGFKPLMKLCDKISWGGQVHSCSKGRSYDGKKSELTQRIGKEDFNGKDILIIDDISIYGGTFKGLSKLLQQRNCGKLYLAVSHMTVRDLGVDPVTNYFDKVFTTNSKFNSYIGGFWDVNKSDQTQPDNLEIINLF